MSKRKYVTDGSFASKKAKFTPSMVKRVSFKKKAMSSKYRDAKAKIPETKFQDTNIALTVSNAGSGGALNICNIAQGSDYNQRIGRSIRLKSVHYKLLVSALAASLNTITSYPASGSNAVRIALVNDKQNNNAGIPTYDLVWGPNTGGAIVTNSLAPRNPNYIDRFDVLADDVVMLNAGGPLGSLVQKYVKLNLPCAFNTQSGGTPVTNCLLLFVLDMNDSGVAVTSLYGQLRVNFFDD